MLGSLILRVRADTAIGFSSTHVCLLTALSFWLLGVAFRAGVEILADTILKSIYIYRPRYVSIDIDGFFFKKN